MLSTLEPASVYITFNLNLTFELAPLHHGGDRAPGPARVQLRLCGRATPSLTLELESDMLSTLEPESAYSAFNLNPCFLSLHPYIEGAAAAVCSVSETAEEWREEDCTAMVDRYKEEEEEEELLGTAPDPRGRDVQPTLIGRKGLTTIP